MRWKFIFLEQLHDELVGEEILDEKDRFYVSDKLFTKKLSNNNIRNKESIAFQRVKENILRQKKELDQRHQCSTSRNKEDLMEINLKKTVERAMASGNKHEVSENIIKKFS